ncbi:MAG: cytochrome c oxidase assembly protein [Acidimicrobiales bacterium]
MTDAPAVLALLALAGAVYGVGARRLGRRLSRTVTFYLGLAVLAAALLSRLDGRVAESFSAHMVQHLLFMLVAAPLLAFARPVPAVVAGLPTEGRAALRRMSGLRPATQTLTNPLVVGMLGVLALWGWHMPSLYRAALSHTVLHAAEHACFLGTALLFWALVFGSGMRRGVSRPVALLLVFATGLQSAVLGAVLAFASTPLYGTTLEDQQLAGALMWGPPGLLYAATMGWLLVRWFAEMEGASRDHLVVVGP